MQHRILLIRIPIKNKQQAVARSISCLHRGKHAVAIGGERISIRIKNIIIRTFQLVNLPAFFKINHYGYAIPGSRKYKPAIYFLKEYEIIRRIKNRYAKLVLKGISPCMRST